MNHSAPIPTRGLRPTLQRAEDGESRWRKHWGLKFGDVTLGHFEKIHEDAWLDWTGATARSAVGVFVAKLVAAILLAQIWVIPMQFRLLWNFLPVTGFFASGAEFRRLATWSTILTASAAIILTLYTLATQRRRPPAETLGTYMAIPMVLLLVGLEWLRNVGGHHLIETVWLWRLVAALAATTVLFAGFWDPAGDAARQAEQPEEDAMSAGVAPPPTTTHNRRVPQQGATTP